MPNPRKISVVKLLSFVSLAFGTSLVAKRADATINVGAEAGLVKRTADWPDNLKLGVGLGLHGELDLIPLLKIGPYYLHYQLSASDDSPFPYDAVFNTLGLRARLVVPIPGSYKPYAYAGAGYSWVSFNPTGPAAVVLPTSSGHFIETPLGVGIAYTVIEIFQLSLDAAYRPGFSFGGDAYDRPGVEQLKSGWSLLLGAALSL
jgi:hypothetical protein